MKLVGYDENVEVIHTIFEGRAALTVDETAQVLGISPKTVRGMVQRVKDPLPSFRACGRVMIPVGGLARYMCVNRRP